MVIASRLICRIPTWYQLKSCFYSEFKHHHDSGSFPSKHIGTSEAEQRFMLEKIGHSSRESFLKSVFQWRKLAEFTSESVVSKETVKNGGSVEIEGTYVVLDSSKDACSLPLIGLSEQEMELEQQHLASLNTGATYKSFLGQGYYNTYMPAIIRRAILENPRWYTSYTPYQPEISQGRLEMLFYYQRMISSLTELPIANASLLDEGSAACEAMLMAFRSYSTQERKTRFLIDNSIHPQVENVLKGRADSLKITLERFDLSSTLTNLNATKFDDCFGVYFQYPNTFGELPDFKMLKSWIPKIQCLSIAVIAGTDPLALCLLKTPGWLGVDISVGSVQRFGLPMGNGGPHAAFIACKNKYLRKLPGRLVGRQRINEMTSAESSPESKADAENLQQEQSFVYRLSLQTREQHIRRERATSNICTAQVLPANLAVAFAMYHGPTGLVKIAKRVEQYAATLLKWLKKVSNSGHSVKFIEAPFFDTIWIEIPWAYEFQQDLIGKKILIRRLGNRVIIALDEMTTLSDIQLIMTSFKSLCRLDYPKFCHLPESLHSDLCLEISKSLNYRIDSILSDKIFNTLQSEVSFSRYLYSLGEKDYSLVDGIIPLGSCTMKLNSVVQLLPLSMKGFMNIHPFLNTEFCELTHIQAGSSGASTRADVDNPLDSFTKGYSIMNREFMAILKELTGMYAGTLQPNSGSQGELLGISLIRAYFKDKIGNEASTDGRITSNSSRTKCLIPVTAHGTNPASAILSGFEILPVPSLNNGHLNIACLASLVRQYKADIAFIMLTIPSTFGLFEDQLTSPEIYSLLKEYDIQIYMDGANMNALLGYLKPAALPKDGGFGADVLHLNLHKTFSVPHGGGGPGAAPVLCKSHLAPFLPNPTLSCGLETTLDNLKHVQWITSTPTGSNSLVTISYSYVKLMGLQGLQNATFAALLSANYLKKALQPFYEIPFVQQSGGLCGHEFIIRAEKNSLHPSLRDIPTAPLIAKRLMNYGIHSPTLSWPIPDSLMAEITESEPLSEIHRLLDGLICISRELQIYPDILIGAPWTASPSADTALLALDPWKFHRNQGTITRFYKTYPTTRLVSKMNEAQIDREIIEQCSSC